MKAERRQAGWPHAGSLAPEWGLVVWAVKSRWDAEARERVAELLGRPLDWGVVEELALRHRVLPLLSSPLTGAGASSVPERVRQSFGERARAIARRNFVLAGELLRLLALLARAGVSAIPLKGPLLAEVLYGDVGLRQFDDLDILVRPQDAERAREVLANEEYHSTLELNRAQEAAYRRDYCAYDLWRESDGLLVELHWRLAEAYFGSHLPVDEVWERLQRTQFMGREVGTCSAEDLLILLCVHGCKHLWVRLGWLCDVAAAIAAHPGLDWGWVMGQAKRLGCARMVALGLTLARQELGVSLPQGVGEWVASDGGVAALTERVRGCWACGESEVPSQWELSAFHLRVRERWRDRAQYAVRLFITPTPGDYEWVRLPSALFPLYYVLRPFRLVKAYALPLVVRSWPRPR